jgi:hypothetical protein
MAPPIDVDELQAAWRALDGAEPSQGWRTIRIARDLPSPLLAGRWFPDNHEALLVGFTPSAIRALRELPQGRGFEVGKADLGAHADGRAWIALRRHAAGRLDLFSVMAHDVINVLAAASGSTDSARLQILLARIRAWQDFMRGDKDGILGPEAEVGLFGELEIVADLIDAGIGPSLVLDAWRGPQDGLQDFVLGQGAIETKTSASPAGFSAKINSLEQLDDSVARPIFVAAVRIAQEQSGETLPERVARLRGTLAPDPAAVVTFGHLLLHAGFTDLSASQYSRRFSRVSVRLLRVDDTFPRITRATAPIEVRSAQYELDLDLVRAAHVTLPTALHELGVLS